jgi:hypothetical protein
MEGERCRSATPARRGASTPHSLGVDCWTVPLLPRASPTPAGPLGALLLLAAAASASLWRPWGVFAFPSLRFFAHTGLVVGAWLLVAFAATAALRRWRRLLAACVAAPAGTFLAAGILGPLVFPASERVLWGGLLAVSGVWLLTAGRWLLGLPTTEAPAALAAAAGLLLGAAEGAVLVLAERPPPAATHPAGGALPPAGGGEKLVELECGAATLEVTPLLTLVSTSRDGFWPGFSARDSLEGPPPPEGPSRRAALSHGPTSIDATTVLPAGVASHLGSFTDVTVVGALRPAIHFEGTPSEARLGFHVFDYPHGRPAHFAYVRGGRVHVARGTDAEKGPFVELAEGRLPDDGVLRFTLYDGDAALCTMAFHDFAAQADTTSESPAAGEGIPPNAIQFGVLARGAGHPFIHLGLAETGIGVGLRTVWHARGTYRNRVEVIPR